MVKTSGLTEKEIRERIKKHEDFLARSKGTDADYVIVGNSKTILGGLYMQLSNILGRKLTDNDFDEDGLIRK